MRSPSYLVLTTLAMVTAVAVIPVDHALAVHAREVR
jgi:hypothetical protein